MNQAQIEAWTLAVLDDLQAGRHIEDARVELKARWPDDKARAARRIAGHANAARGESILWVIGADEKAGIVGAQQTDVAQWYDQIAKCFDGFPPPLTELVVRFGATSVVALHFDTSRAPFVVTNPSGGPIALEVPWREGTKVRSARREDLVRLLVPTQRAPVIDVLGGVAQGSFVTDLIRSNILNLGIELELYIVPMSADRVVIPFHYCQVDVAVSEGAVHFDRAEISSLAPPMRLRSTVLGSVAFGPPDSELDSVTIAATSSEIVVDGPGRVVLRASVDCPDADPDSLESVTVRGKCRAVNTAAAAGFRVVLARQENTQHGNMRWQCGPTDAA